MKKRIVVAVALLLMICAIFAVTASASGATEKGTVSGSWTYTISNGNATITAYSGNASSVEIPETIDGYRVTALGRNLFSDNAVLTSVTLPKTLEKIESYCFQNCSNLAAITLPENLYGIGYHAFYNCTALSQITVNSTKLTDVDTSGNIFYNAGKYAANGISVTFGNNATMIPKDMFYCDENNYARVKSVTIGNDVVSIGSGAFINCLDLTTVSWGSGLEEISSYAFQNCTSLTSVTLPEKLATVGYRAFYNCTALTTITINAANLSAFDSSGNTFYNAGRYASGGVSVSFGKSVTQIPAYLFACNADNSAKVTSVKIGDNVTTVGYAAFQNCAALADITWGSGIIRIDSYAFQNCSSLSKLPLPASVETIERNAFQNCTALTDLTLPKNLSSLGYRAFYGCTALSNITVNSTKFKCDSTDNTFYDAGKYAANGIKVVFSAGVTTIPDALFNCSENYYARVKSVSIGNDVVSIGSYAFQGCIDLTTVTWGTGLEMIENNAFQNCTSLKSVTLPKKLARVRYKAFYNCTALENITVNATALADFDSSGNTFYNAGRYAPNGISVTFESGVTTVPAYMFSCSENNWARVKSVAFGNDVATIGKSAFQNCTDLSTISWGDGLKEIGSYAFANCSAVGQLLLPAQLEKIGSNAFQNCTALTTLTLPTNLSAVLYRAFYNCTALSSITVNAKNLSNFDSYGNTFFDAGKYAENGIAVEFNKGVTTIPAYMFLCDQNNYARVRSVKIGASVTEIKKRAFENCFDLNSVTYTGTSKLSAIESNAFTNCRSLPAISLPVGVDSVGYQAFYGCKKLAKIEVLNRNCTIDSNKDTLGVAGTTTIYGNRNSTAQTYAEKNGYTFVAFTTETTPEPLPFKDVPANEYYADAVRWAVSNNVTSGTSATTFSPNANCTRAQVVTFLWRAAGSPNPKSSHNPFKDVKSGAYYYKAVLWAVENKITSGTSSTTFSPDESCTRAQVVTFLWRYEGTPTPKNSGNPFRDVKSGSYYYTAVLWAVENKVTSGTSSTTFSPNDTCTRAQVVTFLYRDIA
ncbi:MAG: leucine-rich repeat protein [Faecousia sp.]